MSIIDDTDRCGCDDEPCTCEIRPEDVAAFKRACAAVNRVLPRIRRYLPTANVYLDESTATLMTGASHVGRQGDKRQDRVRASVTLPGWDGGGW